MHLSYLSVGDDSDPVWLFGSGHAEHRPKEDRDWKQKRDDAARHESVEHHREVAEDCRVWKQHFAESDEQAQNSRHVNVKTFLGDTTRDYLLIFAVQLVKPNTTNTHRSCAAADAGSSYWMDAVRLTTVPLRTSQLHWSTGSRCVRVGRKGWPELWTGDAVWQVNSNKSYVRLHQLSLQYLICKM